MGELVSLEEHDRRRLAEIEAELDEMRHGRLNGIACPRCGAELRDSAPPLVMMSLPPQVQVHCPGCGWIGTRVD